MLHILPAPVRGTFALGLYTLNTLFWCVPLFLIVFAKAAVPFDSWMRRCSRILNAIAENWIWVNNQTKKLVGKGSQHPRDDVISDIGKLRCSNEA